MYCETQTYEKLSYLQGIWMYCMPAFQIRIYNEIRSSSLRSRKPELVTIKVKLAVALFRKGCKSLLEQGILYEKSGADPDSLIPGPDPAFQLNLPIRIRAFDEQNRKKLTAKNAF
jgi:hypothetical protein